MKTISFGEILWDIIGETEHIGGAALNFAAHLAKLGTVSCIVSAVGTDKRGERALASLQKHGINPVYVGRVPDAPTGTVTVELDAGQPTYTIHEGVAWDCIRLSKAQLDDIRSMEWDCCYFGTLAQRSEINRVSLRSLFSAVQAKHWFCDINLRQHYYSKTIIEESFRQANIVKLNNDELELVSGMFGMDVTAGMESQMPRLVEEFGLETLIVTLGKDGVLVLSGKDFRRIPVKPVDVADAVGAGDSFSASFMYALGYGADPFEAASYGAALGSFTAAHSGDVPEYDDEIRYIFQSLAT